MNEPRFRPTVLLTAIAVVAGLVAITAGTLGSSRALGVGTIGMGCLALGLLRGLRLPTDVGFFLLFIGVIDGGFVGGSIELTLLGTVAVVLGWDLATSAIDLGAQLGREARTIRLELVQTGSTLFVGLSATALGYLVYLIGIGGQPIAAILLLIVAACFFIIALGTASS